MCQSQKRLSECAAAAAELYSVHCTELRVHLLVDGGTLDHHPFCWIWRLFLITQAAASLQLGRNRRDRRSLRGAKTHHLGWSALRLSQVVSFGVCPPTKPPPQPTGSNRAQQSAFCVPSLFCKRRSHNGGAAPAFWATTAMDCNKKEAPGRRAGRKGGKGLTVPNIALS